MEQPKKWAFNGYFELSGPLGEDKQVKFGSIYIQAAFLPKGSADDVPEPEVTQDLQKILAESTYKGVLQVRVVHIEGIKATDSGLEGSKSDPYVKVLMPDKKEWSTTVKKNCLAPFWDDECS